jgi:hypothetical protein
MIISALFISSPYSTVFKYSDQSINSAVISNTAVSSYINPELTAVKKTAEVRLSLKWPEQSQKYNMLPDTCQIILEYSKDGSAWNKLSGSDVSVSADSGWTYTYSSLDGSYRYRAAIESYSFGDTTVASVNNDGTNASVGNFSVKSSTDFNSADNSYTTVIENSAALSEISLAADWNDDNNRDGLRATFNVVLYRDGKVCSGMLTLNKNADWTCLCSGLPVYKNGSSTEKSEYYLKTANVLSGYSSICTSYATLSEKRRSSLSISNTHTPDSFSINTFFTWCDGDNAYSQRPEAVSVQLEYSVSSDGKSYGEYSRIIPKGNDTDSPSYSSDTGIQTLSASDNSLQWRNLPVYWKGYMIRYRITSPECPSDYSFSLLDSHDYITGQNGVSYASSVFFTLTAYTDFNVSVDWKLPENQRSDCLPDSVSASLYSTSDNGASWTYVPSSDILLSKSSDWSYTYKNLRKSLRYSIRINNFTYADASVSAESEGNSPDSYTVGNFKAEIQSSDNNSCKVKISAAGSSLKTKVIWNDSADRDGIRPDSVRFDVYRDGILFISSVSADANGYWISSLDNLPVYKDGSDSDKSVYTVTVINCNAGYSCSVSYFGGSTDGISSDADEGSIRLTFLHTPYSFSLNTLITAPDTITANLCLEASISSDGEQYSKYSPVTRGSLSVSSTGGYSSSSYTQEIDISGPSDSVFALTWNDLPVYSGGYKIHYRVTSESDTYYVLSGSSCSPVNGYAGISEIFTDLIFTDMSTQNYASCIRFDDNCYKYNAVPDNIKVMLQSSSDSGTTWTDVSDSEKVTDAASAWSYFYPNTDPSLSYRIRILSYGFGISDLPADSESNYTVTQSETDGNVSSVRSSVVDIGISGCDMDIDCYWNDDSNRDLIRPSDQLIQLYRDGEKCGTPIVLKSSESWEKYLSGLPCYKNGSVTDKSLYSLVNISDNPDYISTYLYSGYNASGAVLSSDFTAVSNITNSHTISSFSVNVTQLWNDSSNSSSARPLESTLTLQYYDESSEKWKNVSSSETIAGFTPFLNETPGSETILSQKTTSFVWTLPCYGYYRSSMYQLKYRIISDTLSYSTDYVYFSYSGKNQEDLQVSSVLQTTQITAHISWDDYFNQFGERPDDVSVCIERRNEYSDWGLVSTKTHSYDILNDSNNWQAVFSNLPLCDSAGNRYEYRVIPLTFISGETKTSALSDISGSGAYGPYVFTSKTDFSGNCYFSEIDLRLSTKSES